MALTTQQPLFEADGGTSLVEAVRWIEGVLFGEVALVLCTLAVAAVGGAMLTGRLPIKQGLRVVLGCFILLGAPGIAAGIVDATYETPQASSQSPPVPAESLAPRPDLPPANYDPYDGASFKGS